MQYGIDWLVTRRGLVFGLGWIGASDHSVAHVRLELTRTDGSTVGLPASRTQYHDVVSPLLSQTDPSALSGFIVYGRTDEDPPIGAACLRVDLNDGTRKHLEVPIRDLVRPDRLSLRAKLKFRRSQLRKALILVRRMMFLQLLEKLRSWRSDTAPLLDSDPIPVLIRESARRANSRILVVIDHELGGGANRYRKDIIEDRVESGGLAVVVSFSLRRLQYVLEIHGSDSPRTRFGLASLEPIREMADRTLIEEVFFNNALSFPNPGEVPDLLVHLKKSHGILLSVATHDYFVLCPSQYLLDSKGDYCDLPDLAACRRCLPRNDWVLFGHGGETDIEEWRHRWGRALTAADAIFCFSDSSSRLLRRVFPDLTDAQIQIRPHSLGPSKGARVDVDASAPLRIGVVGTITHHKGSKMVAAMAERIRARDLGISITIIGTCDAPLDARVVSVTGRYDKEKLPRLVERSGANVMFLPSIVPETFSYVTAELMALGLPVVCFDLGAPAERVASYPMGKVIPLGDADMALDHLLEFHDELGSRTIRNDSA